MTRELDKYPVYTMLILTALIFVIGIVLLLISKFVLINPEDDIYAEIIFALSITLITASTVGLLTELFLKWFVAKKIFEVQEDFLGSAIPKIFSTLDKWVTDEGKRIPVEKSTIYELLRIGYRQWFMNENFDLVKIPSSRVSTLYQNVQLSEFKEPVSIDFSMHIKHSGYIDKTIVGRDDLINLDITTEFSAVNTSSNDHPDLRYINRNGIVNLFTFDIFEQFPKDETARQDFLKRIQFQLTIQIENDEKSNSIIHLPLDYVKYLRNIQEKTGEEIGEIIKAETGAFDMNKNYLLYYFSGEKEDESKKLIFGLFCPYQIKPQQRIKIFYKRRIPFAENDYLYTFLNSLTRGLSVQVEGFDVDYDVVIAKFLLSDEPSSKHTKNLLYTSSLLLPRSTFIVSWQKKKQMMVK